MTSLPLVSLCSVPGRSRHDFHRVWFSDDVSKAVRIWQHQLQLPRGSLRYPVVHHNRRPLHVHQTGTGGDAQLWHKGQHREVSLVVEEEGACIWWWVWWGGGEGGWV